MPSHRSAFICGLVLALCPPQPSHAAEDDGPEMVLQVGGQKAHALALSPDGHWLATAGDALRLWEVSTGRLVRVWAASPDMLAFTADGRFLVGAGVDGPRAWRMEDGQEVPRPSDGAGGRRVFGGVGLSADGRWFVHVPHAMYAERITTVRDALSGETVARLEVDTDIGLGLAVGLTRDGRLMAVGRTGRVDLWDVRSGRLLRSLTAPTGLVSALAFDDAGRVVVAGGPDGTAVWDVDSGATLHTLAQKGQTLTGRRDSWLAVSPDGRWLAVRASSALRLWDLASGTVRDLIDTSSRPIPPELARAYPGGMAQMERSLFQVASQAVAFSGDGRWLGAQSRGLGVWEMPAARRVQTIRPSLPSEFKALTVSPDARWFASVRGSATELWDLGAGRPVLKLGAAAEGVASVGPEGRWVAWFDREKVSLWDTRQRGEEVRVLARHPKRDLEHVAFSADGRVLATVSRGQATRRSDGGIATEGTVTAWDVASGRQIGSAEHGSLVHSVAVSPDGRLIAVGTLDGLKVWAVGDGLAPFALPGTDAGVVGAETEPAAALAFGSEGRWLAEGGSRTRLWDLAAAAGQAQSIWDTPAGPRLLEAPGHPGFTDEALAVSADGRWVAAAATDGTTILWDAATGQVQRTLRGSHPARSLAFVAKDRWLLATDADGVARLWDLGSGALRASIASFDWGQWLVTTPEGFFDGSPEAWRRILWRFGSGPTMEMAPVEAFFADFYQPGLLADVLAGREQKVQRRLSAIDRRAPKLRIGTATSRQGPSSQRTLTVSVEVEEAAPDAMHASGSGARDVRLFRNGSLVKAWRGDVLGGRSRVVLEISVRIVAGPNRFTAYAFNRDNVKSGDASLEVVGAESLRRAGTTHVLAVGINRYANPGYDLRYAVADAQAFTAELRRQQLNLDPSRRLDVLELLDQDAVKANVLAALARLAGGGAQAGPAAALTEAQPEDTVVLFFAGHGTAAGPRYFLIPHDLGHAGGRQQLDEAAVRSILAHSISDLELEQAVEGIDAGRMLLVLDACNSGQALEAEEKRRGPMNSRGLAQLAHEKGMAVLTASQGYQAALEAAPLGHGFLTYALVEEGLKGGAADRSPQDGEIALPEWLEYAEQRVPELQLEMMREAARQGRALVHIVDDEEEPTREIEKRKLQHPRAFLPAGEAGPPLIVGRAR